MVKKSISDELLIFLLIPFQYFLDGTKHPLKRIPVDIHNLRLSQAFHTCLPGRVSHQRNLPEVVSFLEFVHSLRILFCDQLALCNHVKLVALFALLDDILSRGIVFLTKDIA